MKTLKKIAITFAVVFAFLFLFGCTDNDPTYYQYNHGTKEIVSIQLLERVGETDSTDGEIVTVQRIDFAVKGTLSAAEVDEFGADLSGVTVELYPQYAYISYALPYDQGFRILYDDGSYFIVSWCYEALNTKTYYTKITDYNANNKILEETVDCSLLYYVTIAENYFGDIVQVRALQYGEP